MIYRVFFLIFLITTSAWSQAKPAVPSPWKSDDQFISPVKKGNVVPFSGVLFSPGAAASVASEIDSFPEKLRIEIKAAKDAVAAQKDFEIAELKTHAQTEMQVNQAMLTAERQERKIIEEKTKNAESNKYYYIFGGIIAGSVLTFLTVFSTQKIL